MKTQNKIKLLIFVIPMLLTIMGCKKEYKTITKVNPDGSCERTFIVTTGSRNTNNTVLPLPYDSTWQTNWVKDTSSSDYTLTAKKDFKSYDDLSKLYRETDKLDLMKVNLKIEKKFKWFFTYYQYDEKFNKFNLFNKVPISEYLTQQELDNYIAGKKDTLAESKVKKWEERNYIEDFFDAVMSAALKLNDPALSEKIITDKKEELFNAINKSKGDADSLAIELNSFYGTKSFFKLKDVIDSTINSITKRAGRMGDADGNYLNSVIMPGIIINTNADKIEGNRVSWEFESRRFTIKDFEMKAESRVMNVWAVTLSAVIVLLILASLLFPVIKKKKTY